MNRRLIRSATVASLIEQGLGTGRRSSAGQELKQTDCSYRVGLIHSELGLQVWCPAEKRIEVIFDYIGQRFIKLFGPFTNFPNRQRITIHLKARLIGAGRVPIVESEAAQSPTKCLSLIHIPEPGFGPPTHKYSFPRAGADQATELL